LISLIRRPEKQLEAAMRELILKMSTSIDGFVASEDGGAKWIFDTHDEAAGAWTVKTVWEASLHIMGSRTFHDMAAYWPNSTEVYASRSMYSSLFKMPRPREGSPLIAEGAQPPRRRVTRAHVLPGDGTPSALRVSAMRRGL
jgi:hypothetical protein